MFNYVNLNAGSAGVNNGGTATVGIEDTSVQSGDRLLVSENNGLVSAFYAESRHTIYPQCE